jgi:hypothetical protein
MLGFSKKKKKKIESSEDMHAALVARPSKKSYYVKCYIRANKIEDARNTSNKFFSSLEESYCQHYRSVPPPPPAPPHPTPPHPAPTYQGHPPTSSATSAIVRLKAADALIKTVLRGGDDVEYFVSLWN